MTHCIFYCNQHAIVLSYNFFSLLSTNSSFFMLCLSIKSQGWNRCNDDEGKGLRGKRTIRVVNRRHAVLSWRKRATRHYDGRSRWVLIIDAWSIFSFSVMCIYIVCLLAFLKWEKLYPLRADVTGTDLRYQFQFGGKLNFFNQPDQLLKLCRRLRTDS